MATTKASAVRTGGVGLGRSGRIALGIAGAALTLAGFGVLVWVDWRVALGVFLAMWGLRISDEAMRLTREAKTGAMGSLYFQKVVRTAGPMGGLSDPEKW